MATKKLLVINTSGLGVGGITTHMINYITVLKDKGDTQYDVTVISSMLSDESVVIKLKQLGCKVIFLPSRKTNLLQYRSALKKIMKNNRFDILHVHGNSPTMMLELRLGELYKIPIRVAHCHNSISNHPKIYKLMSPLFKRTYTTAVAASKQAGNWIFGKDNFTVLNNAIFVEKYKFSNKTREDYRKRLNISEDEIAVAMIGNINKQKNPFFLNLLLAKMPNNKDKKYKFLIVGDGPLKRDLETKLKKYGNVKFYGVRNDVPQILQAVDVLLMPSLWEGLPLILVEAQATGLKCIISDKISPEVLINKKIVKRLPLDVNMWKESLLKNTNVDRLSEYQVLYKSKYNIENNVHTLQNLYK